MLYIAAPFFNPVQLQLVEAIETLLTAEGVPFFSPRTIHGPKPVKIKDDSTARSVFDNNVQGLDKCIGLLAVVDYLMPEGQELMVCHGGKPVFGISVPDTGVSLEIGYVHGQGRVPVYLFTTRQPGQGKLNIMLTQAAAGVIYGLEQLRLCADRESPTGIDDAFLQQYQGGHT